MLQLCIGWDLWTGEDKVYYSMCNKPYIYMYVCFNQNVYCCLGDVTRPPPTTPPPVGKFLFILK